jgi:hypothetical protein
VTELAAIMVLHYALLGLGWALLAFVALVVVCHLPILPLIRLAQIDVPDRLRIAKCFLGAWVKGTLMIIPDLLAPVIVPIALLFTKWDAEKLPKLFHWWDNDVSINGDVRQPGSWALQTVSLNPDSLQAIESCYWAPDHHPRSFYARWVWLGLRNRASRLAQLLGTDVEGFSLRWAGEGWTVNRVGNRWRYFELLPVGRFVVRLHYGYKVPRIPGWDRAPVVAIGFSLRRA